MLNPVQFLRKVLFCSTYFDLIGLRTSNLLTTLTWTSFTSSLFLLDGRCSIRRSLLEGSWGVIFTRLTPLTPGGPWLIRLVVFQKVCSFTRVNHVVKTLTNGLNYHLYTRQFGFVQRLCISDVQELVTIKYCEYKYKQKTLFLQVNP